MSVPFRAVLIASAAMLATACAPQVARHGFQPVDVAPTDIVVGTDTRETVQARLGSPSVVSTFEPNVWFYISQTTAKYTFNLPEVSQRSVTQITFDETNGRELSVNTLDLEDGQQIAYSDRETPTRGRELTVLEQLLGNVGRQRLPGDDQDLPPNQRRRDE